MSKKALIAEGLVIEVVRGKPFPVADGFVWKVCPNEVQVGWIYDDASGSFTDPAANSV